MAAIRMDRTQWCAPWRRQHGGRRESSLSGRAAPSGPSQKSKIRKMESPRRIWNSCYTRTGPRASSEGLDACTSGIIGSSGSFNHSCEGIHLSEANVSPLPLFAQAAPESRLHRPLRIALFGFGTVGSSVAKILVESKPAGLELTHVFNRGVARKRVDWVPSSVVWSEDADAVLASDVDVIVELAGGLDPAGGWVRKALECRQERGHRQQEADCLSWRGTGAAGRGRRRAPEVWRRRGRRNPRDSGPGTGHGRRSASCALKAF